MMYKGFQKPKNCLQEAFWRLEIQLKTAKSRKAICKRFSFIKLEPRGIFQRMIQIYFCICSQKITLDVSPFLHDVQAVCNRIIFKFTKLEKMENRNHNILILKIFMCKHHFLSTNLPDGCVLNYIHSKKLFLF